MSTTDARRWVATSAPLAARYDDVWFVDAHEGWAVNANGQILSTTDGGGHWQVDFMVPAWIRCIAMGSNQRGWAGATVGPTSLFHVINGDHWCPVQNLPPDAPPAICGLWALDEEHIFAAGDNFPDSPCRFMKSTDGGRHWTVTSLEEHVNVAIDIYFEDEAHGWITGGKSLARETTRETLRPVILRTEDGGRSWHNVLADDTQGLLGEWGWKIQRVSADMLVVSCESYRGAGIFVSHNNGRHWRRMHIQDRSGRVINGNLEGVGFIDGQTGWVGGWGDHRLESGRTSMTKDGGLTWVDDTSYWPAPFPEAGLVTLTGQYINRFRFLDRPQAVAYAAGRALYKFTDAPVYGESAPTETPLLIPQNAPMSIAERTCKIDYFVPEGTAHVRIEVFDRFSGPVKTLLNEDKPSSGDRQVIWDLRDDYGRARPELQHIVRVTCDDRAESRMLFAERDWKGLAGLSVLNYRAQTVAMNDGTERHA